MTGIYEIKIFTNNSRKNIKEYFMTFYCKDCKIDFEVNDEECKGYYNWECPKCNHVSPKKDLGLGFGIVWKCDTGTTKKSSYIEPVKSGNSGSCDMKGQCGCACEK
jgi:hypothetical protein